jgi:hypothetical protein
MPTSSISSRTDSSAAAATARLRCNVVRFVLACVILGSGCAFLALGVLLVPLLRERTWVVLPVIMASGLAIGNACLVFWDKLPKSGKGTTKD